MEVFFTTNESTVHLSTPQTWENFSQTLSDDQVIIIDICSSVLVICIASW